MKNKRHLSNYALPLLVGACLVFASFMILQQWRARVQVNSVTMMQDLQELKDIFSRIHKSCVILGFESPKTSIDFLNVGSFEGADIGGMSLMYPKKWEGPYLKTNLGVGSIDYQIVRTNKGYYIMPGDGVILPNGKTIGTDIIVGATTDIDTLVKDPEGLVLDQDKPLAVKIDVSSRSFGYVSEDELADI